MNKEESLTVTHILFTDPFVRAEEREKLEQRPEIRFRRVSVGRALRIRRSPTLASLLPEQLEGMIVSGQLAARDLYHGPVLSCPSPVAPATPRAASHRPG